MEPAVFLRRPALRNKDLKRLHGDARPLDAWERYRALNDAVDEAYDLIDISNREARFALILMGALNALLVVAASRADVIGALAAQQRVWAAVLLGLYALAAVYFILQAIEALRPGRFRPKFGTWTADSADYPKKVRYFEDVVQRDLEGHWQAWREVQIGQLNAELAVQLHGLCIKNEAKRAGLRRLYAGLRIMTLMVTGLLALFFYAAWAAR
jgi:hypothetical protein